MIFFVIFDLFSLFYVEVFVSLGGKKNLILQ